MIEIIHSVNNLHKLEKIPPNYGIELDLRGELGKLVLSHDFEDIKNDFDEYIRLYKHNLLVVNIKESGIEDMAISKLINNNISNFFLLDVEFPYILQKYQEKGKYLSLRFSKYEGIDTISNFIGKVKWVWIDTYEDFDLNTETVSILKNFSLCLVSPARWGRKDKVEFYINKFKSVNLKIDAVMIEA